LLEAILTVLLLLILLQLSAQKGSVAGAAARANAAAPAAGARAAACHLHLLLTVQDIVGQRQISISVTPMSCFARPIAASAPMTKVAHLPLG
jgi:hypothetical protein